MAQGVPGAFLSEGHTVHTEDTLHGDKISSVLGNRLDCSFGQLPTKCRGQSRVLRFHLVGGLGCGQEPGLPQVALCLCPARPEVGRGVAGSQSNDLLRAVRRGSRVSGWSGSGQVAQALAL